MAKNLPGLAAVAAIALVMCGGACAQAQASPGPDPVLGRDCRLQDPGGDPAELNRTFTFVSQVVVAGTLAPPRVPCGAMGSESVVDNFATERALAAAPAVTAIAARHPEIAGTCIRVLLRLYGVFNSTGISNTLTGADVQINAFAAAFQATLRDEMGSPEADGCACTSFANDTERELIFGVLLKPFECHLGGDSLGTVAVGCPVIHSWLLNRYPEDYNCDTGFLGGNQSHVHEITVNAPGRLEIDQCGSPNAVAMRLFRRTSSTDSSTDSTGSGSPTPASTPRFSGSWELVRGFDDGRCSIATVFGGGTGTCDGAVQREDSRAALVTWWLEPGQLALVIDHTSTTLGVLGGAVDYTVSLRAAVNPMRGGAGETWLDPYGLGLANETLDRIGAMSESSGSVVLSAFPWTIHGTSHTPPAALRHKWRGIAYAPNTGKLYGAPSKAESVLVIDAETNTSDSTGMVVGTPDGVAFGNWSSLAYAPNTGKLYAVPLFSSSVLIIDPVANTTDTTAMAGPEFARNRGKWNWESIAYAPSTGKLYAAPHMHDAVLVIDPETNKTDVATLAGLETTNDYIYKWKGIAYVPSTRKLYGAPHRHDGVLIIDPEANTTDVTAMSGFGNALDKWSGLALAPTTGKLYAAPARASSVLIIDPDANTTDIDAISVTGLRPFDGGHPIEPQWQGIVFLPSTGLLYASPYRAAMVLIIDPFTNTTDGTTLAGLSPNPTFDAIALVPATGKLYGTPAEAESYVGVISHTRDLEYCAANHRCAVTCLASGCGWDDDQVLCRQGKTTSTEAIAGNYRTPGESCEPFQLADGCSAEVSAPGFRLVSESTLFVTGQSVIIPGPQSDGACASTRAAFASPTSGNFDAIRFDLAIERADGERLTVGQQKMFSSTNPVTGETSVGNLQPGNYTATLRGLDAGDPPQQASVANFSMEVRDHALEVAVGCQAEQRRIQDAASNAAYFLGDSVSVPGFSASCDATVAFEGASNPAGVFFRLLLVADDDSDAPFTGTKLIDATTGEMLVTPRSGVDYSHARTYTASLVAIDGGRNITVAAWPMEPRQHDDTHFPIYGPNGRACVHGDPIDIVPLDRAFDCDCRSTAYTGDNCDELAAAVAGSNDGDPLAIAGALGSVLFVILVLAVAFRVQVYRLKHRPIDMDAMQVEVLESLGMALPKNIGDHEFGISLTTSAAIDPAVSPHSADDGNKKLAQQLAAALAKILPRLAAELQRGRVTMAESNRSQLLLVIPRPRGYSAQSDIAERTAAAISKQVQKGRLSVGPIDVIAAALAVPRRHPRELDRNRLTRMAYLGEGAFGEVDLYQVDESRQRGVPPYKVAAKAVKPGVSAGRDELLKEAALMAVMEHRNVLALVGVVTAPRDLPALILLEYCDGGELLDRVRDTAMLSTTAKLTYAAQVALGMQYISARNIVHRDLAARNVLLDAMGVCKVADFGMSASLVSAGQTYAAEYVRLHEEVALRWASPEALQHQKFSEASDVWAFGVLTWEIFGAGVEPYSGLGLGEIGPFVKGGGRLAAPEGCPADVFAELMLPCWASDPMSRSSFGELYDAAVAHGALEDAVAAKERREVTATLRREQEQRRRRASFDSTDRAMLGISVEHMRDVLAPIVRKMVSECISPDHARYRQDPSFRALENARDANIWHATEACVKPTSLSAICPRDGKAGTAYVDMELFSASVQHATAFLSYAWGYRFREVVETLAGWCSARSERTADVFIWMDALTLNQHRLEDAPPVSPGVLQQTFGSRVVGIGRMIVMLDRWDRPGYLSRAWCLFELYTAIRRSSEVEIHITLSPAQRAAFRKAVVDGGYSVVDGALGAIRAEDAEAREMADLEAIRALIQSFAGGFDTLNETVRVHLAGWFQAQGGIKVVRGISADGRGVGRFDSSNSSYSRERAPRGTSRDHAGRGSSRDARGVIPDASGRSIGFPRSGPAPVQEESAAPSAYQPAAASASSITLGDANIGFNELEV